MKSDQAKRLALFMPSFRGGGAERVMVTLAGGFLELGVPVDIVVAQREGPNLECVPEGTRVLDLKAPRVLMSLPGLVGYLRREEPYAMLAALSGANVVSVVARSLARVSTKVVVSEHTIASLARANAVGQRASLSGFMKLTYPKADGIVAVSDGAADDLAAFVRVERSRITRIYNPVVTPALLQRAEEPVDDPWFTDPAIPVVLSAGRLTAAKDLGALLHAFASVRRMRPCRLVIIGEGEERPRLGALAQQLGVAADVALPGFVSNPYRYMRRSSVFVLSSRWEGFANVLVEAMACGTPVVSTDCPGGPREILAGGRYGALVPWGDTDALAAAIIAQLDTPRSDQLIQRAQAFDVDAAIERYRSVLAI